MKYLVLIAGGGRRAAGSWQLAAVGGVGQMPLGILGTGSRPGAPKSPVEDRLSASSAETNPDQ